MLCKICYKREDNHAYKLIIFLKDADALNPTDKKIRAKVYQLVEMGTQNVMEVKRAVDMYVSDELFKGKAAPSIFNRRFCPTRKDVKNMVYKARQKILKSNNDQENTSILIEQLKDAKPEDNFFFRPFNENNHDELLFVHQSSWQRHLLLRYGQCICTLDATYNTTRYALPLFFVCVKSNVGYMVVATFITQHERGDSISEALNVIRSWNPEWQPSSFMMDHSEAQMNAVSASFGTSKLRTLICKCILSMHVLYSDKFLQLLPLILFSEISPCC